MRGRTVPGESPAALRVRAEQQKAMMRMARSATRANAAPVQPHIPTLPGAAWKPLGPAPLASDASGSGAQDYGAVSGRATAVAIDSADPSGNTVFLGGAYGGIWRSTNAGSASTDPVNVVWTPVGDNQPTLAVGAIAIQPRNSDPARSVVLVGTGEANSSTDSYYGLGILRSTDGGTTWETPISQASTGQSLLGLGFSRIAFSTGNPNIVVAGTTGTAHGYSSGLESASDTNRGLYYSTDGGETWSFATPSDNGIAISPESVSSVVYSGVTGQFFAAIRLHGLYSSPDGVTWTRLANQPGTGLAAANCPSATSSSCPIYRGEIAVVPGRNEMYVWYVDGNSVDQGIWQTKDGGTTWTNINDSGITNCGDVLGCGTSQGFYNLELVAVPNGSTATDIYAGAENIYKCQINSAQPTCSGSGSNTFLNLTHVYGCPPDFGSIAHVHPDQHAVAFVLADGKDEMYFANDGGIYRALDGFAGLTTGNCSGSNQFDDLNQTLGSMTQFVSFSVHPSDPNTILGGTQDNGSPATNSAEGSTAWETVNGGDGGYNAINSSNPLEWFTANTDVSIQRCTNGTSCHSEDFVPIVEPATLSGDHGAFYTPYLLDPQPAASELIVGTCRVWRGPGTGGTFTALSNSFETGSGGCTGTEVNMVRALAIGGAPDGSGLSNVIYAGTDGGGAAIPGGGHLWVTTDAADGTSTWSNRTANINPSGYPISSIALDPADLTGHTAFVTIMGFHVSHVWKTTNAGVSWLDFTGTGLPDAPANAVLVDGQSGTVFVGTDVGVFSSSVSSPAWTEIGPSNGSMGFLPNAAVTALRIFNGGGMQSLRASTYGRGIWEIGLSTGPDFEFNVPVSAQTIFPGQTATFEGTVSALNGYNAQVALICIAGTTAPPSGCAVTPTTIIPTSSGTAFSVTSGGTLGDYAFQIHGAGNDASTVTRLAALALHVVDFGLGTPSPANITVAHGTTSQPVQFQVSGLGSFSGAVQLRCSGLPAGSNCSFSPSANVTPTSSVPVNVSLTLTVPASSPTGTFPVTITAMTNGAPAAKNQTFSLTVVPNPDFALTIPSAFPNVPAGSTASGSISIVAIDGFTGKVGLSCSSSCATSPATISSYPASAAVTVDATNLSAGAYSMTITGTAGSLTHTLTVPFIVAAPGDFTIAASPSSQQIAAGQSARYNVIIGPANYSGSVFLSLNCPAGASCSLSCVSVTPANGGCGTGSEPAVLSVLSSESSSSRTGRIRLAITIFLLGCILCELPGSGSRRTEKRKWLPLLSLLLFSTIMLAACGGGLSGNSIGTIGDPPGNTPQQFQITINGNSGAMTASAQVSLTVQ